MTINVHPHTRFAAALLAASVVAAGAAVTMPVHDAAPRVASVEVRQASVITDALWDFQNVVGAAASAVSLPFQLLAALPTDVVAALAGALQNPAAADSALSHLLQLYLNPTYIDFTVGFGSFPYIALAAVLAPLASALPGPLRTPFTNALLNTGLAIGSAFNTWPDPAVGADLAIQFENHNVAARLLRALLSVIALPVNVVGGVVVWVASVPAELEGSLESALKNPADIPGLVNHLAQRVVDVAETVTRGVAEPLFWLPAPIGYTFGNTNTPTDIGLVGHAILGAYDGLRGALDPLLGPPVLPSPFLLKTAKLSSATSTFDAGPVTTIPVADAKTVIIDLAAPVKLEVEKIKAKATAALEKVVHKPELTVAPPAKAESDADDPAVTPVVDHEATASRPTAKPGRDFIRAKVAELKAKLTEAGDSLRPARDIGKLSKRIKANRQHAESAS